MQFLPSFRFTGCNFRGVFFCAACNRHERLCFLSAAVAALWNVRKTFSRKPVLLNGGEIRDLKILASNYYIFKKIWICFSTTHETVDIHYLCIKNLLYMSISLLISLLIVRTLVIAACTTRFNNILKSAFCPRSIFMCFLGLFKLTTITSLVSTSSMDFLVLACWFFIRCTRCVFM